MIAHQLKQVRLNSRCIYLVKQCLLLNSVILEVVVNIQHQNREILQVPEIKPGGADEQQNSPYNNNMINMWIIINIVGG